MTIKLHTINNLSNKPILRFYKEENRDKAFDELPVHFKERLSKDIEEITTQDNNFMNETVEYKSEGVVLGNYWGGGSGSYPATTFHSDISKEHLIEQNIKALESGALDSGMGYESLIGALIIIDTITTIAYKDKLYVNVESNYEFIGELTEEQIEFLKDVYY